MAEPNIARMGWLSIQVCVPAEFTDEEAIAAGEKLCRCGTEFGWHVASSEQIGGDPERVTCTKYPENVHIVLIA